MPKPQFRPLARNALRRAIKELDSGDADRLPYAALELRKAMECLAYERLLLYRDELPEDKMAIWQPRACENPQDNYQSDLD